MAMGLRTDLARARRSAASRWRHPLVCALACALGGLLWTGRALAQPQLHCQVTYAGTAHTIVARPVTDPYSVPSVDIGGRFAFKAVMVGQAEQVDRIALYAYMDAQPHPVLIHQAKYLPPYPRSDRPVLLTGLQHLYAGPLERELMYSCTLQGLTP